MRIHKNDAKKRTFILDVLKNDSVVVLPTDTIYGFSGKIYTTKEKIQRIKGRNENKPFIILIEKPDDVRLFSDCTVPDSLLNLWPGPLTLILPMRDSIETVALRCPGDMWLRNLIGELGSPLYSTSCNRSGFPPLTHIDDIEREFGNEVALVVEDVEHEQYDKDRSGMPSTIVSITEAENSNGYTIRVLRQGAIQIPPFFSTPMQEKTSEHRSI